MRPQRFAFFYLPEVAEMCFTGIASQLGGLGFEQIALRTLSVHDRGFSPDGGYMAPRFNGGR